MNALMVPIFEAALGRYIKKSQELEISVPTLLDQMSHKLDILFPVTQQEAVQATTDFFVPAKVKERLHVRTSPIFVEAIERAKAIPEGNEFSLGQLYANDWERIPSPRVFGRLFKQELEKQGIARHIGDDKEAGMAKYLRL